MDFRIDTIPPEQQPGPCIVLGVYESRRLSPAAEALDQVLGGRLKGILEKGDMDGKLGQTLLLYGIPKLRAERILLVGLGHARDFGDNELRKAVAASVKRLDETGSGRATSYLTGLEVKGRDLPGNVGQATLAAEEALYRFDRLKKKKDPAPRRPLHEITWQVPAEHGDTAQDALQQAVATARGIALAKDLGNLPGNICTPTYLADQARELAERHPKLEVEVLEQADMEELGMGALLSVAKGSRQPPKLIVLQYRGSEAGKPVALVGKGITFDAGGISIKPAQAMDEMKYDMCGAASVLGTVSAVADLSLPIHLVALIPSCENLPDGAANKPGDIVTSMSGQTIEVLNTDAEGRLILCDTLTYCERFEPDAVVDIATLTGACVVALGKHPSGLLGNHPSLNRELLAAGKQAGDRAWELPLWEDYQEQLKSNFADMANIGGREAGAVTAACFLSRFAKKLHWAHLDIAGTAWTSGSKKGATGRPVGLLTRFLIERAAKSKQS
jgi:leucyl aminopeptidase